MKRKTERIDSVIKFVIEKLDKTANPASGSVNIEKAWEETAGEKAFVHSKPASLRKKKLVINVDGSSWLYELTLRKEELLDGLKKKLGKNKIKELQFRIGEL
ncbi:MAG: DciA family protein [Candidatus Omnitrophota bacterium]|nr:DciA family protein [Candidatus Omnitrophota bacterium]